MTTQQFAQIPLAHIVPSPTNPRKTFHADRLAELAESIKASGVHQPVLVRPLPGERLADTAHMDPRPQWELVSGERRLRASLLAEMDSIPAMVRALSDAQALDIQLVENLQREDLEPLEEAEGYDHLMHAHEPALTADEVAAKIGKSRSYVYSRLKLLDLCPEGREALRTGKVSAAVALLLARIPSHKVQAQALGNVVHAMTGEALSVREASALIQRQYMLRLGEARFKITDASLVPAAGSCRECPKRTGAAPDLFADVPGADVCTDVACFRAKEQAHTDNALKAAREAGATIIEGREAKALVPHSWNNRVEGFLRLDSAEDSPTGKPLRAAIGKLLDKEGIKPTLVADPHHDGALIAVVDHATASRLLAQKGHQDHADAVQAKASQSAKAQAEADAAEAKKRFENAWRWEVLKAAWGKIADIQSYFVPEKVTRHLAERHLPGNAEDCKKLCKLLDLGTVAPRAALVDWIKDHSDPDAALALVVMFEDREWQSWKPEGEQDGGLLNLIARYEQVDVDAIKARVQAEHTALVKAKNMHKNATCTESQTPDLPLNPAAQAPGGRGGAKPKTKKPGSAAPARGVPKTTEREAALGIAAAMQGLGEGGGDCAPLEPDPDGASAVGEVGRATSPDAGADQTIAPGARVVVLAGEHAGQAGTVIEDRTICIDEPTIWGVHLDGTDESTVFEPAALQVLQYVEGARVRIADGAFLGLKGTILRPYPPAEVDQAAAGKWVVHVDGKDSNFLFPGNPSSLLLIDPEDQPEGL